MTALIANAQPGPTTPTRTPLSTGPSIAPNWNVDDTMLIALRTWVTPTISVTNDCRTGLSTAATTPRAAAKT